MTRTRHQDVDNYFVAKTWRTDEGAKSSPSVAWLQWFLGQRQRREELGFHDDTDPQGGTGSRESAKLEVLQEDNPVWGYACFKKKRVGVACSARAQDSKKGLLKSATKHLLHYFRKALGLNTLGKGQIQSTYQSYTLIGGVQHFISVSRSKGHQSFLLSSKFGDLQWREVDSRAQHDPAAQVGDGRKDEPVSEERSADAEARTADRGHVVTTPWPSLRVLLPLSGRHQAYVRFLDTLSAAAARYPARVHLGVALFSDPLGEHALSLRASRGRRVLAVSVVRLDTRFSRAVGLTALAEGFDQHAVLIFIDVDLVVTGEFLRRVAWTVKPGTAYFPTMFSKYSPKSVCYGRVNCTAAGLFDFSGDSGFWRSFGYGMVGVTAGDLRKAGGLNTKIFGWGKEDVDFYAR